MIWHSTEINDVLRELEVDENSGLINGVADMRLQQYGKNVISNSAKPTMFKRISEQLKSKYVYALVIIAVISFILNLVYAESSFSNENAYAPLLIIAIVLINAVISAYHLYSSDKAMRHLSAITNPNATVIREGIERVIPSFELVPGDVMILHAGDYITADARIISTDNVFRCNEVAISGENIPVDKNANEVYEDITTVGKRGNMVYSGTSVVSGNAKVVVVATGRDTELGHTSTIVEQTGSDNLPIQKALDTTGKVANIIVLVFCALAFIISLIQNFNSSAPFASMTVSILVNVVALAIAAIPEALPAITTLVISLGIHRIIKDGIILKKTRAIENLGRTSVICSDKTGIITHNRMNVDSVFDGEDLIKIEGVKSSEKARMIIRLAAACSTLDNDSTEAAIQKACYDYISLSKIDIENLMPQMNSIPFDSQRKSMCTINMISGVPYAIVKGAPETVIPKCLECNVEKLLEVNDSLTGEGLRVVCIALKKLDDVPAIPTALEIETDLTFAGLIAIADPPRSRVIQSIANCDAAGIRTVMITGDNLLTARAVARQIGILKDGCLAMTGAELAEMDDKQLAQAIDEYTVFARVSPDDKLRIIRALQSRGNIVAVTGNDLSDVDALSAADVGCAMGKLGADVAKGNADIILANNDFGYIVNAIKESRGLFYNIQKAVVYLLGCNLGELICYLLALLIFKVPPLLPAQLLLINLLTDCAPIFSLSCDKANDEVMKNKPLALSGNLFDIASLINILAHSLFIAAITVCSFLIGFKTSTALGMTMAFTTLGVSEFLHSFNSKTHASVFKIRIKTNSFMFLSTVVSLFLILFFALTPVGQIFGLALLDGKQLIYALLLALLIIPFGEVFKLIIKKIHK